MFKKLFCVLLALMLCAAGAMAEGLTVQGAATVSLEADTATISLGIRQFAPEVRDAQQAVNRSMDAVIAALTEAGVDRASLYTNSIYIYPEYDYSSDTERIRGYSASNSLTIVTRDIENVGAYIDAAFDAGANTLDDVSFSASDTQAAYDEALEKAVAEARRKAQVLADAAGLELGGIVRVAEGDYYGYGAPVLYARSTEAVEEEDAGTQVIAARQQVSASVTVEFEVK